MCIEFNYKNACNVCMLHGIRLKTKHKDRYRDRRERIESRKSAVFSWAGQLK